jgi:hypothetical protein
MSDKKLDIENMLIKAFAYKPKKVNEEAENSNRNEKVTDFPKPRSNSNPSNVVEMAVEWIEKGNVKNPLFEEFILKSHDHYAIWQYATRVIKKRWPVYESALVESMGKRFEEFTEKQPMAKFTGLAHQTGSVSSLASLTYLDDYISQVIQEGDVWEEYEQASNLEKVLKNLDDKTTMYDLFFDETGIIAIRNLIEYSNNTGRLADSLNSYFEFCFCKVLKAIETEKELEHLRYRAKATGNNTIVPISKEKANIQLYDHRIKLLREFKSFKHKTVMSFESKCLTMLSKFKRVSERSEQFKWKVSSPSCFNFLFEYLTADKNNDWPEFFKTLTDSVNETWLFLGKFTEYSKDKKIWLSEFADKAINVLINEIYEAKIFFPSEIHYSAREYWFVDAYRLVAKYVELSGKRLPKLEDLMLKLELEDCCREYVQGVKEAKKQGYVFND